VTSDAGYFHLSDRDRVVFFFRCAAHRVLSLRHEMQGANASRVHEALFLRLDTAREMPKRTPAGISAIIKYCATCAQTALS